MKCPYCNGAGEMKATFGSLLLHHRKNAGLTQQDVAAAAGVTRAQIANLEADRSDVPLTTLLRLAAALNVEAKDLVS